eukprot:6704497-Prymnesium_polylepis.1
MSKKSLPAAHASTREPTLPPSAPLARELCTPPPPPLRRSEPLLGRAPSEPVSYTHLRAHETLMNR